MKHRIAIAATAAAALIAGACADRDGIRRLSTEPGDENPVSYVTTGSGAYVDRNSHRLVQFKEPNESSQRIRASIVAGSSISDGLQVSSNEPGVAYSGGSASYSLTDDTKHRQTIVLLYAPSGGPPAAMQHYVDGALVSTTAYTWGRTASGWVRTRSVMRSIRNGTLVGTYTTTTTASRPGDGGRPQTVRLDRPVPMSPMRRAFNTAIYGLAFAFAPQDASAQAPMHYSECQQQWLHFIGAAAILVGTGATMDAAPVLTPILLSTFINALAMAAAYEDQLIDCILDHERLSFGAGTGGGGGGGAGGGGSTWECLQGSYAPHCSTPFTL